MRRFFGSGWLTLSLALASGAGCSGTDESEGMKPTGGRVPVNVPMPEALFHNTSRLYPGST